MIKFYILDTNILLYDPNSLFRFKDNHVVIPLSVVKELDGFKKEVTELGRNARTAVRLLDELRREGLLSNGVKTSSGGTIEVVCEPGERLNADDQILEIAKIRNTKEKPCIVITQDVNLRVRCDVHGIAAEDYEAGKSGTMSEIYGGHADLVVPHETMMEFRHEKKLDVPKEAKLFPNEYISLGPDDDSNDRALGRVSNDGTTINPLIRAPREMGAVQAKNREQNFFLDALLDDTIHLVTVAGKAGSGKTLLSVAAGFHLTVECKKYMKMLVSRPVFPMGRDIGFLPGEISDKLAPWMRPIYDAFDFIADHRKSDNGNGNNGHKNDGRDLMEKCAKVEIEPLMYIRGRSIHRQFVIVDECQNLSPLEIKTIVTRAGPGTKMVLTGDIYQIDNPYVDSLSNGLSYLIGKMKGQHLYGHISLQKGVRSPLSDLAATLL